MTILEKIIEGKRREIENRRKLRPLSTLLRNAEQKKRKPHSLVDRLRPENNIGIIAEFKTRSPSKGIINETADVVSVTKKYYDAGAAGLSILTDNEHFGGSFDNLRKAREANICPILQKDFILDEYQVAEAYILGADVILLIAAALDIEKVKYLSGLARGYDMEVILEVHNRKEMDALNENISIVGVNNRNLETFITDINTSFELADHIPGNIPKISESGISNASSILELEKAGFSGFLVGEQFMREHDPGEACRMFINRIREMRVK